MYLRVDSFFVFCQIFFLLFLYIWLIRVVTKEQSWKYSIILWSLSNYFLVIASVIGLSKILFSEFHSKSRKLFMLLLFYSTNLIFAFLEIHGQQQPYFFFYDYEWTFLFILTYHIDCSTLCRSEGILFSLWI